MNCIICNSKGAGKVTEGKFCFVKCATCGVKYHYPLPTKEYLGSWYSKKLLSKRWKGDISNAITENYKQNRLNYPKYLELVKDVPVEGVALDVGCYAGHFLTHLIKRGFSGIGVDLNGGLVEYGKSTFGVDIRHGELRDLNFNDSYFSLVTCHQVFEHVRDPYGLIVEIARILKPGGFVAISVPDASCNTKITYPEHLFHFVALSISTLFNRAGMPVVVTANTAQKALFALGRKHESI